MVSRQIDFDSYNNICLNVAEKTNEKVINYTKRKSGNDTCPKNEFHMKGEKRCETMGFSGSEKNPNTDLKLRNVEAFNMNISERIHQTKNPNINDNTHTPPVSHKYQSELAGSLLPHQWVNSKRANFASITLVETHNDYAGWISTQNPINPAEPPQASKPENQTASLERLRLLYKKNRRAERANTNKYSSSTIP